MSTRSVYIIFMKKILSERLTIIMEWRLSRCPGKELFEEVCSP